jgi:predicted RNA-binding Zn ribbon-like protein
MKSVGVLKSASRQQRLRSRPAPEAIARLLQIVNDVPKSADPLKDFVGRPRDPSSEEVSEAGGWIQAYRARWILELKEFVRYWGESARRYVLEASEFEEIDKRYRAAPALRKLLESIADQNRKRAEAVKPVFDDLFFELPAEAHNLLDSLALRMSNANKHATIEATGLLKTLIEEAELDRIKSCAFETCGKLFWAGRIDRPCCSEPCRNAYRQKRHRLKKKQNEEYRERLHGKKRNR